MLIHVSCTESFNSQRSKTHCHSAFTLKHKDDKSQGCVVQPAHVPFNIGMLQVPNDHTARRGNQIRWQYFLNRNRSQGTTLLRKLTLQFYLYNSLCGSSGTIWSFGLANVYLHIYDIFEMCLLKLIPHNARPNALVSNFGIEYRELYTSKIVWQHSYHWIRCSLKITYGFTFPDQNSYAPMVSMPD